VIAAAAGGSSRAGPALFRKKENILHLDRGLCNKSAENTSARIVSPRSIEVVVVGLVGVVVVA
jgi:hypothetical protein